MTREELTTIIGLLDKVDDKRLIAGTMWDDDTECYCAQGAICPVEVWDGVCALVDIHTGSGQVTYATREVHQWAESLYLSADALYELMSINDNTNAVTPEIRYITVMEELRKMLEACP